jgi:hypothetical protein
MGVIYHFGNAMCGRETHACRTMARPRAVALAFESDAPSAVGTEEPKKNNGRGRLFYIDPASSCHRLARADHYPLATAH